MAKSLSLRAQARLKREVKELRERLNDVLNGGYPGTPIASITPTAVQLAEVKTARKLGFSIVVRDEFNGQITLHAVPSSLSFPSGLR
ncbi:MAG: hypothetical protein JWM95_4027 [Gemmatimonadetes bacterium]|nr:hypothetical protein [Gemmatimonadota bacterium]